jgi:anti-sigma factor RsiW
VGGLTPISEGHVLLSLGLYVLGRLDPSERERVGHHLLECGRCRADHDVIAGTVAHLASVTADDWRRLLG